MSEVKDMENLTNLEENEEVVELLDAVFEMFKERNKDIFNFI